MSRSLRRTLALALSGGLPLVTACSASAPPRSEPQPRPYEAMQEQAYQARDYYFPSSASMRAVYGFDESAQLPSPLPSHQGTGSVTVQVTSYTPTHATLQATTVAPGEDGQPGSEATTTTLTVAADGTVVVESDGATRRYSNAVFTPEGATVMPASGSELPALRTRMVGTETITVPAGTFQTVHLQEALATPSAPVTDLWLARGVGVVRQRLDTTFPVRTGENETQQGRASYELRLEQVTP